MDKSSEKNNSNKKSNKKIIKLCTGVFTLLLAVIGVICHFRTSIISQNFFEDSFDKAKSLQWVTFDRVVDGDTLICYLDNKKIRVRLIGLDTPESVHEDEEKNTVYGTMASDHTKQLLEGYSNLYLEYDKEVYDKYDRLLAYVWLSDNSDDLNDMLNYIILTDGYGINRVYGENSKYASDFEKARTEAETDARGLWQYQEYIDMVK